MGVLEAGLFPGLAVYLTFFYTKHELARRVGFLFVSAAIGGGLGGLLAFGIGHMDGVQGMSGWRWIFIIEGLPSFALGIATYFALPNDAQTAYFLTPEEKAFMLVREQRDYGNTASSKEFSKVDMKKAFKDWKVWAFSAAQFGSDTMLYGKDHSSLSLTNAVYRHANRIQGTRPFCQLSSMTWGHGLPRRSNCSPSRAISSVQRLTWLLQRPRIAFNAAEYSVSPLV